MTLNLVNPEKKRRGSLRSNASALVSRMQLALTHGMQFDGARNLYTVFGYKQTPSFNDYLAKYVRGDIAKRLVDAFPAATWSRGVEVTGGEAFNTAWEELVLDQQLWNRFERLDRLCGLGKFAVMVLGFGDQDLTKPAKSAEKLLYTTLHGEVSVKVTRLVINPADARFGLPEMYEISLMDPEKPGLTTDISAKVVTTNEILVHYTRILHISEGNLDDDIYGIPRMASVYNRLDDLDKVVGGSAETYWLAGNRGMHADVDKEMEMDATDESNLTDELDEYQHQLRRFIRTRGVTVKPLGSDVPNPKPSFEVILSMISGATGIPQRILLGSEAGHLASEQDRANWADRVVERRTDFAETIVLRPFIKLLVEVGVLPEPVNLLVVWPEAFSMSPLEQAQVMAQKGRALANMTKQYEMEQSLVTPEEARGLLGFEGAAPPPLGKIAVEVEKLEKELEDPDPEEVVDENGVTQTKDEEELDKNGRPKPDEKS